MLGEGAIGTGERQDGLLGAADRTLGHSPRLDFHPFEEVGYLVEACDDEPVVGVGGLVGELGVDLGVVQAAGPQDPHRPVEVGVGDLGVQDLLVRGRVEPPGAGSLLAQEMGPFR